MSPSSLVAVDVENEEGGKETSPEMESPRPFPLRYAEGVEPTTTARPGSPEFDDPTTVEHTSPDDEDAHTDEA